MSRLQTHKQKEFTRKLGLLIGAFILISILFFTIGFKILISISVFLANTFSHNKTPVTASKDFYGTLDVDVLPTATNSAKIIVSGSSENFDTIEFYINSKKVKEAEDASSFSEEIGDLQKGQNTIYVKAIAEKEKQEKKSEIFTVQYKSEKLKLEITEPQENQTVHKQELKVAGTTEKEASVRVNGAPVVVDANANFTTTIRLKEGDNTITIIAEDLAGNEETKTISVKYQKDE